MKANNLKLMVCFFLLLLPFSGFSQRGMSAKEFAKQETELMKNNINKLTEIQYERVYNVNLKYTKKILEYKRSADRSEVVKIREKLKKEKDKEIKKILTKAQYKEYTEYQTKQKQKRKR